MLRRYKAMLVGALLVGSVGVAGPALAEDGNELLAECDAGTTASEFYCLGFILGADETLRVLHQMEWLTNRVCEPEGVSRQQVFDIVKKYLRDNPDKRHFPAAALVFVALKEAFPCEQ